MKLMIIEVDVTITITFKFRFAFVMLNIIGTLERDFKSNTTINLEHDFSQNKFRDDLTVMMATTITQSITSTSIMTAELEISQDNLITSRDPIY